MVDFTVAIPTYNGEERLPDVLERLRSQIDLDNLSWEVIVVDNNSKDNTAKVVQDYQAEWPAHCPLRYCLEPRQGASFARQRAVTEAKGTYIGFLDDDNVPAPNWVAAAYAFGETHPEAGAFGSRIQGDYEVAPPEEFKRIACYLAIIERGSKPRLYQPEKRMFPPGAGLVVLRQAWLEAVPKRLFLNNTGKEAGLASEDLEVVLHIQKAGWELWYNPEMQVQHKIPHWRLERDYLVSVFRCIGLSSHHIRMLSFAAWQRPFAFLMYLASDLRKLVLHFLKYRKVIKNDLIAACEMELLVSNIISPFFLWRKRLLRI
ncbi:glycosyltransferase family 2 protein [Leptolyngbya sp. FACHB-671]|uniref:hormogonium polysaccharide biosynthesis glycosyltransferase HpsE n=1 Tax=Leptolyngbya sp. FACHB-671 TaxID=2692812 RepID=UPI001685AD26|nr:hormogonium polysaccharide biosynthesis glycosyltransferase HpsE [Leptolyngbya sp. FACHB-671]MBD2068380.1 glycosyltransferase family 2 protein [Leptolyngbya sp. FACHB-671]